MSEGRKPGWSEDTHGHLRPMLYKLGRASEIHGLSRSRTHRIWYGIKSRCDNPTNTRYGYYGGRGIKYESRWMAYECFLADMGEAPAGMTLDRIDVNGNYSKANCRWATRTEQSNNKRNSVRYEIRGREMTLAQWRRELGCKSQTSTYKALLEMVLSDKELQ